MEATRALVGIDAEGGDEFASRLFDSALGALDLLTVYLGERLGLYRALDESGPASPAELAHATGTQERLVREWLEQQAVSGLLHVDDVGLPAELRRYALPEERASVLVDPDSLDYAAPLARFVVGLAKPIDELFGAFAGGGPLARDAYGEVEVARAELDRPHFLHLLARDWLAAVPEVRARLEAEPPARVAIVACGAGWPAIAIARALSTATVDGFDSEKRAIVRARANAEAEGVGDRVRFVVHDAATEPLRERYQLIAVFGGIHELVSPVDALETIRKALAEDGAVLVMDAAIDAFTAPGPDVERFLYQWSVLFHLPVTIGEEPSTAPAGLLRPETLRHYAREAGFASVELVPIPHRLYRLYRLVP